MSNQSKCKLYIVGQNGTGKTILIDKIINDEDSPLDSTRGIVNTIWDIVDNDITVKVEIMEKASLNQTIKNVHEKEIQNNSIVILVVSSRYNNLKNDFYVICDEYLKEIPNDCTVIIFINGMQKDKFPNIQFDVLRFNYPFIREIVSYDLYVEKLADFNYLLKNIIINKYTDRLNYAKEIIRDNLASQNTELDLGNCALTSLYEVEELFKNTHIEKLILSNEWAAFRNVKWHKITSENKLGKNTLGNFPPQISKLKKLKELIAGGDWNDGKSWWNRWRIDDLNPLIGLTNLEYLNISNNRIKVVPALSRLKKLTKLHLNNNDIYKIDIRSNSNTLDEIYLSNNHITSVSFLKYLLVARTIDLHGNNIQSLAPAVNQINKMNIANSKWEQNTINIAKNPLEQPPMEIVNTGKEAVLSYFYDISKGESFVNKDVKLILVGNSGVGKSTLSKYLNREIDLDKEHPSTHWMEEKKLKSKHIIDKIKEKCNINLFDFGGHDYFHDTHHLFFSKNTVYLLMWDKETNNLNLRVSDQKNNKNKTIQVQTQDYPLKYWLDSIKYFTKEKESHNFEFEIEKENEYNSLVLLIQNKTGSIEETVHLNNRDLFKNYPFLFEILNISIKPKRNLEYLDTLITEMLNRTQIIGAKLPFYYSIVKNNILKYKGKPILSINEFNIYCNSLLKTRISTQQTTFLADYLKQIGVVLYYPASDNSDKVYVNKKWIIEQIYLILDGLNEKDGEFNLEHLNSTLGTKVTNAEIQSIINLMIEFKIIFKHPESDNYIAPLYLPLQPIKAVELFIDKKKIPFRRFMYNGFIHKNVVLNFFQEYGKLALKENSGSNKDSYYYWKDGLVIKDSASNEIVMVQFNIGDINGNAFIDVIKINNDLETDFVHKIINYINEINKDFEIDEMVTLDGIDYISLDILNKNAKEGKLIFTEKRSTNTVKALKKEQTEFKLKDFKMFLKNGIKKKKVVISYSKKDIARVHTFIRYLKPLEDLDLIEHPWHCTAMNPADEWDSKIQSKFNEADIIFFMISEYFYSTEYIIEKEIKVAINRYDNDKTVKIIPIILEHYEWGRKNPYNLKRFSALPYQAKPISDFNNEKLAWNTITVCVKAMIEKDLDPAKIDIISKELQDIYERQVEGKLDFNS